MQSVNLTDHSQDNVKAGVLYKRSRLGLFWKKRWVHASNGEISYSTDPVAPRTKNTISLDLATVQVKPSSRNRHRFEITTAIGHKYEFAAETSREVNDWIRFLRHQLLNRKTFQQQASEGETLSPDAVVHQPSSPGSPKIMSQVQQLTNQTNDHSNTDDIAWNDMYQSIIEQSDSTFDTAVSKTQSLNQLILDFVSASTRLSKVIIQEYTLPAHLKTIHPLDTNDQIPEEETFMSEGIVFQYMQDPNGTDVQDELRRKTCTHDLHGIQAYANSTVKGLHTYLCCIVDFLGFRMFCLALVPIYDDSHICFGRVQGQYHIDTSANLMLEQAANELGLATHLVQFQEVISDRCPHEFVSIHCSSSLMVHNGEDQRMYVTSLTRAFPIDHLFPSKDEFSTRQLRPEFLKLYGERLSPDAFIISGANDSQECENNLDKALHYLRTSCIEDFVRELDYLHVLPVDSAQFTAILHSRGINVRYLGKIAETTKLPHVREIAVCEMVARACKQLLNQKLRKISRGLSSLRQEGYLESNLEEHLASEKHDLATKAHVNALQAACAESFSIFLSSSGKSVEFWQTTLVDCIERKFAFKLSNEEGSSLHRPLLLNSLQYHCGVRLSESGVNCLFESSLAFSANDIAYLEPRCKWPNISNSKCNMFPLMAEQYMNDGEFDMAVQALRLKLDVILCYQSSLATCSNTQISPLSLSSLPPPPPPPHLKGKSANAANEETVYSSSSVRVRPSSANILSVSSDIHSTLNDLCEAYICIHDVGNARFCAKRALELSQGQDARTSATYAHLGNIYQTSGQSTKADQCLKISLSILKRLYGLHHPLLVRLLDDVGNRYIELGLYSSAEESLSKALELALVSLGKTHPATAELYSSLGRLHKMENDLDKAKEAYEKACLIYEGAYGAASAEVAGSCSHLSEVMNRKGDSQLAKYYQDRMLKTRMQIDESTNAYFIE